MARPSLWVNLALESAVFAAIWVFGRGTIGSTIQLMGVLVMMAGTMLQLAYPTDRWTLGVQYIGCFYVTIGAAVAIAEVL